MFTRPRYILVHMSVVARFRPIYRVPPRRRCIRQAFLQLLHLFPSQLTTALASAPLHFAHYEVHSNNPMTKNVVKGCLRIASPNLLLPNMNSGDEIHGTLNSSQLILSADLTHKVHGIYAPTLPRVYHDVISLVVKLSKLRVTK